MNTRWYNTPLWHHSVTILATIATRIINITVKCLGDLNTIVYSYHNNIVYFQVDPGDNWWSWHHSVTILATIATIIINITVKMFWGFISILFHFIVFVYPCLIIQSPKNNNYNKIVGAPLELAPHFSFSYIYMYVFLCLSVQFLCLL